MFIEIDENGYATGAWSETEQPFWKTFFVSKIPENLNCYKVVDGKLVYQEDKKEKLLKAEENSQIKQNLRQYLNETDWFTIRQLETGKEIPKDIFEKRQEARNIISAIEEAEKAGEV